jgi:hypothetical protein
MQWNKKKKKKRVKEIKEEEFMAKKCPLIPFYLELLKHCS